MLYETENPEPKPAEKNQTETEQRRICCVKERYVKGGRRDKVTL